jgi:hypothetical protein
VEDEGDVSTGADRQAIVECLRAPPYFGSLATDLSRDQIFSVPLPLPLPCLG